MIKIEDLTLKYPSGKGIEKVCFTVGDGQVVGYLGPNGAGKTTTIRCLMGFSEPQEGICQINGLDCSKNAPKIQTFLGYIPGEIAFFDGMSGDEFLSFLSKMRGTKNTVRKKELLELFELNPTGNIKKYSKGMKQKIGIVAAFMDDPQVLILDEPTSGLDPLMQSRFVDLILSEKKKGKTILMSSHMFEEVERTCDQVVIIKDGKIAKTSDTHALKLSQRKSYILQLDNPEDLKRLIAFGVEVGEITQNKMELFVKGDQLDPFIKLLSTMKVLSFQSKNQSLEDIFLNLYGREEIPHEAGIVQS